MGETEDLGIRMFPRVKQCDVPVTLGYVREYTLHPARGKCVDIIYSVNIF